MTEVPRPWMPLSEGTFSSAGPAGKRVTRREPIEMFGGWLPGCTVETSGAN